MLFTKLKVCTTLRMMHITGMGKPGGLTERTIQRIENHEAEPSKHALNKIGEVLNCNLNEQKRKDMTKKQRRLNIFLIAISILIVLEFLMGWLTWEHHWWVLVAWFFPLLGGVSIPYFKKK